MSTPTTPARTEAQPKAATTLGLLSRRLDRAEAELVGRARTEYAFERHELSLEHYRQRGVTSHDAGYLALLTKMIRLAERAAEAGH